MKKKIFVLFSLILAMALPAAEALIASGGKSDWKIVVRNNPPPMDSLAADNLAASLKKITGADFEVVPVSKVKNRKHLIYVGCDSAADLKEDEYILQMKDETIHLYGNGIHGAVNAVNAFLRNQLGVRWYEKDKEPVFPQKKELKLKDFQQKERFAFPYRILNNNYEWAFWQGANMGIEESNRSRQKREKKYPYDIRYRSRLYTPVFIHAVYKYLPPNESCWSKYDKIEFAHIKKRDWFKTNPEFFPMFNGQRKFYPYGNMCWSNKELRKVHTSMMLDEIKRLGENIILEVDTADDGGTGLICGCPECMKLAKEWNSPSGPLLDYITELSDFLFKKHPQVRIRTGIRHQSRSAGKATLDKIRVPAGKKFQRNVIFWVALGQAINHSVDAPGNKEIFEHIDEAGKLGGDIFFWYYPHMFVTSDYAVPFTNLRHQCELLRKLRDTGKIAGIFYETYGYQMTFGPLERYVYAHLFRNPDMDTEPLIQEFLTHYYGPAAPLVRQYQEELEQAGCQSKIPLVYTYRGIDYKREFSYMTLERILRWEQLFDRMGKLVSGNPAALKQIRLLRFTLDFTVLLRWNELSEKYPAYFASFETFKKRLAWDTLPNIYKQGAESLLQRAELDALYGKNPKKLPDSFAKYPAEKIFRMTPTNYAASSYADPKEKIVVDPDAAFGYGVTIDRADFPFKFGFHSFLTKMDVRTALDKSRLHEDGKYHLFKLGEIQPTNNSRIWFSGKSWCTSLKLDSFWDLDKPTLKYDCWVSLKFPKNYSEKGGTVLCDQIILVQK